MADRLEKQLATIEGLIKDKDNLQTRIEEQQRDMKERQIINEKLMKDAESRFQRELKNAKDAWISSEKVRKERWEQEKIKEIREGTVQKLEPTI